MIIDLRDWHLPPGVRIPKLGFAMDDLSALRRALDLHGLTHSEDHRWLFISGPDIEGQDMGLTYCPPGSGCYDIYDAADFNPTDEIVRRWLPRWIDGDGDQHDYIELCWVRPFEPGEKRKPYFRDWTIPFLEAREGVHSISPFHQRRIEKERIQGLDAEVKRLQGLLTAAGIDWTGPRC